MRASDTYRAAKRNKNRSGKAKQLKQTRVKLGLSRRNMAIVAALGDIALQNAKASEA